MSRIGRSGSPGDNVVDFAARGGRARSGTEDWLAPDAFQEMPRAIPFENTPALGGVGAAADAAEARMRSIGWVESELVLPENLPRTVDALLEPDAGASDRRAATVMALDEVSGGDWPAVRVVDQREPTFAESGTFLPPRVDTALVTREDGQRELLVSDTLGFKDMILTVRRGMLMDLADRLADGGLPVRPGAARAIETALDGGEDQSVATLARTAQPIDAMVDGRLVEVPADRYLRGL